MDLVMYWYSNIYSSPYYSQSFSTIMILYIHIMQDMVPELAVEEFSTPPPFSSTLASRTGSKAAAVPTTHHKSIRGLYHVQLGK